jgi:hypothetical protein
MTWVVSAISGAGAGTGAIIGGGLGLIGSLIGANASQSAAQTQANAGLSAQNQLLGIGANAANLYTPYQGVGLQGVNNLSQLANSGYLTQQFGPQQLQGNLAPNYQFMLNQGLGANTEASNVSGGGSNVNRSNQVFAQNYASNAYQNAFNNFQSQRTNILNANNLLAGIGQNAVSGSANTQLGVGTQISNITQGIGNAQAAGQIGTANAYSSGASNIGNTALLYGLLQNQNPNSYDATNGVIP